MGKDDPITREETTDLFSSGMIVNRELMRDIASNQEKYLNRIEVIMEKQISILQQLATSTSTINHNSSVMVDFIKTLKNNNGNGMSSKNENKLIDIIKYMTVTVCGALIGLIGGKFVNM